MGIIREVVSGVHPVRAPPERSKFINESAFPVPAVILDSTLYLTPMALSQGYYSLGRAYMHAELERYQLSEDPARLLDEFAASFPGFRIPLAFRVLAFLHRYTRTDSTLRLLRHLVGAKWWESGYIQFPQSESISFEVSGAHSAFPSDTLELHLAPSPGKYLRDLLRANPFEAMAEELSAHGVTGIWAGVHSAQVERLVRRFRFMPVRNPTAAQLYRLGQERFHS